MENQRRFAVRFWGVALAWLAMTHYLPAVLWYALPAELLRALTLPAYNLGCQVLATLVGVAFAWALLRAPCSALAIIRPSAAGAVLPVLLGPLLFVLAAFLALKIAEPYLAEELAREGAGASRRNAGAFGKALTEAPLLVTLVWGVVLAAVGEELLFRGALFGALLSSLRPLGRAAGPLAIAAAAATFGSMHADMKGSVGIVRVVSTTCLGLGCGVARLQTGSVLASMLLHLSYNLVSLGIGRGWFRASSEPIVSVVPTPVLALAAVGAALGLTVLARAAWPRLRRRRQP